MSRDLHPGVEAASIDATVYPAFLAEVQVDGGYLRFWSGLGSIAWNGETWNGAGTLLGVSPVQETDGLAATGMRFSLSGISTEVISATIGNARQGLSAKLWLAVFDSSGAIIGDPVMLFSGLTDVPEISESGETCTVSMTAESRLIDLERPRVRRYTREDQRTIYPTDKGFNYVPGLQDRKIHFGPTG
jgi:hypothetical protein